MTPKLTPLLLLGLLAFGGCEDDGTAPAPAVASLSVQLVPQPTTGIAEAWVLLKEVYLQPGLLAADPPSSRVHVLDDGGNGWNIVQTAGQAIEVASRADVPVAQYRYARFVVSFACLVTDDGATFASGTVPAFCGGDLDGSVRLTGIDEAVGVVDIGVELLEGEDETVTVLLDVGESFGRTAEGWLFAPRLLPRE